MNHEESTFKIGSYGFGELAQMYLPHIKAKSATTRLSAWIQANDQLKKELINTGFKRGIKVLTPQMVKSITNFLGYP